MNRVVNCTVLSNFAAVGHLDLLRDTIGPLYVPTEVFDEILAGQLAGFQFYDGFSQHVAPIAPEGWLHLVTMTDRELRTYVTLPAHLHAGERACLCIARERSWGLLTDDRAARQQARLWDIPLSGTIGVLLLAIQDGRIDLDDGNALLAAMIQRANYRSPTTDLGPLLP